jgi:multicomponent Na+:H+ antiporter subunit E
MNPLGLNILVAVMWLLLSRDPSPAVFFVGFLVGFLFLAAFKSVAGSASYVRRCLAFFRFLLVFSREFIVATMTVAGAVLFRSNDSLHPNFVTYDITGLKRPEILLLSYCISLTPGTTTVDISFDFKTLVFHALDGDNPDALRAEIDRTLKQGILSFTR